MTSPQRLILPRLLPRNAKTKIRAAQHCLVWGLLIVCSVQWDTITHVHNCVLSLDTKAAWLFPAELYIFVRAAVVLYYVKRGWKHFVGPWGGCRTGWREYGVWSTPTRLQKAQKGKDISHLKWAFLRRESTSPTCVYFTLKFSLRTKPSFRFNDK